MGITTWLHARHIDKYALNKEHGDKLASFGGNMGSDTGVYFTLLEIMRKFDTQLRTIEAKDKSWLSYDEEETFYAEPASKLITLDDEWWAGLVLDHDGKPYLWGGREDDTGVKGETAWHVRALIKMLAAWPKEYGEVMLCWSWHP